MTLPILQIDPLSLSIWINPGSFKKSPAGLEALMMAWSGGDFADAVRSNAASEEDALDAAFLGSWMWHEKRHFFDMCVTSYGAWRLRNMFVVGANALAVAAHADAAREPLVFPMTAYDNAVLRYRMKLGEPPDNVLRIAKDIRQRKRALASEGAPMAASGRSLTISGNAQMEALAVTSQFHCLGRLYGDKIASRIYERHVNKMDRFGLYRWSEAASLFLGCYRERSDGAVELDQEFATAILVAGLCGRWLGPHPPDSSYTTPGERTGRLMLHFGQGSGHFGMTTEEAFARVDEAARALWGRGLIEELKDDLAASKAAGERLREAFAGLDDLCDAFDDYLALRARMLDQIANQGPAGLSPRAFAANWADNLRPWLIVTQPQGRLHEPDEGLTVHFGRAFNTPRGDAVAWAWREHDPNPGAAVALQATGAWNYVIEQAAPLAKLALAGRQHPLMLYPELERIMSDITNSGVDVRFVPGFDAPEPRDGLSRARAARDYAELTGMTHFICDLTGDRLAIGEAHLLSPWEFRRSPLVDQFRARVAEGPIDAELKLALDWSDWIVRADLLA